jgi:hypothetical protein
MSSRDSIDQLLMEGQAKIIPKMPWIIASKAVYHQAHNRRSLGLHTLPGHDNNLLLSMHLRYS